jgi:hypothetical protein
MIDGEFSTRGGVRSSTIATGRQNRALDASRHWFRRGFC